VVAVGRYERLGPAEAEVALVVEDAFQGRGIGSMLLTRLATAARANHIERFVGTVLPENTGVLPVDQRLPGRAPVRRRAGRVRAGEPSGPAVGALPQRSAT